MYPFFKHAKLQLIKNQCFIYPELLNNFNKCVLVFPIRFFKEYLFKSKLYIEND